MSPEKSASTYLVYFGSGETSEEVDEATIRALIQNGQLGIEDHVSKDGGPPVEFYHYDEFVELWQADESFGHIYQSETTHVGPASGNRAAVEEEVAKEYDDQPSPFLPYSADGGESGGGDDLEDIFLEPEIDRFEATQKAPAPMAFDEPANVEASPFQIDFGGASPAASSESVTFDGYDPLSDDILDAVTIRDLLYDSSLFTVLTISNSATSEQLYDQYMSRMEVLAGRQRAVGRSDVEQSEALDSIRRLIFMAYETLRDDAKRREYEVSSQKGGGYATAGVFLKLDDRPSAESLIEESLTELEDEELEPDGLADEDLTGSADELGAEAAMSSLTDLRMVDFSTPSEPKAAVKEKAPDRNQLRVYESLDQTLEHVAIEDIEGLDGELFSAKPPTRVQQERDLSQRRTGARKRALSDASRSLAALAVDGQYPVGLQWGIENDTGKGLRQVLQIYVPLVAISLGVIVFSGLGENETDYSSPSPWFIGRGLLLIGLAVVGMLAIRREPIARLGLFPPPVETTMGIMIGVIVGVMGGFVAPIYVDEGTNVVIPILMMLFISIAHEVFFRGYVTRVLLVTFPSAFAAVALSCLFYGVFFLTFYNVLQQPGFYLFYYSIFLFGCGLGGIYAALYWRSRSVWPSIFAHTGVLVFSMLVAV